MGKETLQTLAEIKMHVRDEHLAHAGMKTRLKRRFGTVDLSSAPPPPSATPQIRTTPLTSSYPDAPSTTEPSAEDDQPAQLLGSIIDQFIEQGEKDGEEPGDSIPATLVSQYPPVSLEELFDFSRGYWVELHKRTGRRSLNEEQEIYNLLDADLPGEEGAEVAVDDTIGDILTLRV